MWTWRRTSQGYCTTCAVAVIAAFLYMAFFIEPRLEPAPRQRSQDQPIGTNDQFANQGAVHPDPREGFWQWTMKDAVGFYTFLLVAVTGGLVLVAVFQAGMFVWQLKLMREGINDAKSAADTASSAAGAATKQAQELRRSADATERVLVELERPWLFLEVTKIIWRDTPLPAGATGGIAGGTRVLNDWFITLKFRNIGRMPAVIEACAVKIDDKASLPAIPDYSNSSFLATPRTVRSGDMIEAQPIGPSPGRPNPLVFYGRVTYKELNGRAHHTGFALEMSWHFPACSQYNNDAYDYYD
jgi:hypothetical protein